MTQQRSPSRSDVRSTLPAGAATELTAGLALLRRSYIYAKDAGTDRWDFAVEVRELRRLGLCTSDFRWLIARGFVEHALEKSVCGDEHRSFERCRGLAIAENSSLVLTESGAVFAAEVCNTPAGTPLVIGLDERANALLVPHRNGSQNSDGEHVVVPRPDWNPLRRELRVAGRIVKRFRVPAASQEAILRAFEEENWPALIDDPLPGVHDLVPRDRLHNAIKRLNHHQTNRLLHFYGNGHGTGIGWQLTRQMESVLPTGESRVDKSTFPQVLPTPVRPTERSRLVPRK